MLKSKMWAKNLPMMFFYATPEDRELQIQAIRLYVLYEDLKLELTATQAEGLPVLEDTSKETRRFYFVRRTFGTLFEVSGAMQALERNVAFEGFKRRMDDKNRATWNSGIRFFRDNHEFLKACRNDVGGHFLDSTAAFALDTLEDTVGTFEYCRRGEHGADVRLIFAYYLVACGLIKNKAPHQSVEDFLREKYYPLLLDASRIAIHSIQAFAVTHLL